MATLNVDQCHRALEQLDAGDTVRAVAANFGVDPRALSPLVSRYHKTNTVNDRPRSSRPRVTKANQDRHIRLTHLRQRFRPATLTARKAPGRHNTKISSFTVRRRLRAANLRSRRPYKAPPLTARHRRTRLQRSRQHERWLQRQW